MENTNQLLEEASAQNLYQKLIEQLNKDFVLANENLDLAIDSSPEDVKATLHEKIYKLIQYKFAEYLNLLYIIDVPESQVKQLDGTDLVILSEQVAFLVLKREWTKVWYRANY